MNRLIGLLALLGSGWWIVRQLDNVRAATTLRPGTPSTIPPGSTEVPNMSSSTARGIRNNNPGNLRGGGAWVGQIGVDAGGFNIYDTMLNGLRALFINLRNQSKKHGLSTIAGIIEKWAPRSENMTVQYIANVAAMTGYGENQFLNLDDRNVARALGVAIARVETGVTPSTIETEAALNAAGY